jgi:hypothetical protein
MRLRAILIMVALLISLGVVYFLVRRKPEPPQPETPRMFVWWIEMEEIEKISVSLPRQGKSEAWVKHEDRYFYFDEPDGPKVDMQRWGGGIPLLLSGPAAARRIAEQATDQQLELYGLDDPAMRIELTLDNGDTLGIEIGDSTPDRQAYYIRRADSKDVYTVDYTWYEVLERLVVDPPYPEAEEE